MTERRKADDLSLDELESLLYRKKRSTRQQRLLRLKSEGRVVEVAGLTTTRTITHPLKRPRLTPTGAIDQDALLGVDKKAGAAGKQTNNAELEASRQNV